MPFFSFRCEMTSFSLSRCAMRYVMREEGKITAPPADGCSPCTSVIDSFLCVRAPLLPTRGPAPWTTRAPAREPARAPARAPARTPAHLTCAPVLFSRGVHVHAATTFWCSACDRQVKSSARALRQNWSALRASAAQCAQPFAPYLYTLLTPFPV
jgi:hypothetical protein